MPCAGPRRFLACLWMACQAELMGSTTCAHVCATRHAQGIERPGSTQPVAGSHRQPRACCAPPPQCNAPLHPHPSRLHPELGESLLPPAPLGLPPALRLSPKLELLDRVLLRMAAGKHKVRCRLSAAKRELDGISMAGSCALCPAARRSLPIQPLQTPQPSATAPPRPPVRCRHGQVLLFCTMTRVLDEVEAYLEWRGFTSLRMDGGTGAAERGELVRSFNDPGGAAAWGAGTRAPCVHPRCGARVRCRSIPRVRLQARPAAAAAELLGAHQSSPSRALAHNPCPCLLRPRARPQPAACLCSCCPSALAAWASTCRYVGRGAVVAAHTRAGGLYMRTAVPCAPGRCGC